ncbi:hypothetical protein CEXT_667041 [Caerostris extrusa]|uniref:Uncharacterized protein n=1 Tax=Caerostris extrusa TaxID=172846 RepID=A0AAV4UY00_CAEEX|nr:hypothetical protein CEXT_667041 [Caerostris extrusa]
MISFLLTAPKKTNTPPFFNTQKIPHKEIRKSLLGNERNKTLLHKNGRNKSRKGTEQGAFPVGGKEETETQGFFLALFVSFFFPPVSFLTLPSGPALLVTFDPLRASYQYSGNIYLLTFLIYHL